MRDSPNQDGPTIETCEHKCHTLGLNPWIGACPICGCPNRDYDSAAVEPEWAKEFRQWVTLEGLED